MQHTADGLHLTKPRVLMVKLLLIGAGGATGALLRYGLSGLAHRLLGASFPWGTLAANLVGCFFIGALWALSERVTLPRAFSPFVFTGMIGALTTFSTYGLESINLLRSGEIGLGVANILASNVLGLLLVALGFVAARATLFYFVPGRPA